jgi:integrase/recombinase XerD
VLSRLSDVFCPPATGRPVIALWLGHESVETTQIYLHADLRQKEEALAKVTASDLPPGRFRPDDELLPILEGL